MKRIWATGWIVGLLLLMASLLNWRIRSRERGIRSDSSQIEHQASEHLTLDVDANRTQRAVRSEAGTLESKLALQNDEVAIIRLPAATMLELCRRLESERTKPRDEIATLATLGWEQLPIRKIRRLLVDLKLGRANMAKDAAIGTTTHDLKAEVEVEVGDGYQRQIEFKVIDRDGNLIKASLTLIRGMGVICRPPRSKADGILIVVGGMESIADGVEYVDEPQEAEQSVPPNDR